MKKFFVEISLENEAFQNGNEVEELKRILNKIKDKLDRGLNAGRLLDINGNFCGNFEKGETT